MYAFDDMETKILVKEYILSTWHFGFPIRLNLLVGVRRMQFLSE